MSRTWRFLLLRTFFGHSTDYIESVYEEIFALKYHGRWAFAEAYSLPIQIRRWFLRRLQKQKEMENEAVEKAARKRK
jgi:hypothetical protein